MYDKPNDEVLYLFHSGRLKEAYRNFGGHLIYDQNNKILGATFTVYAPYAKEVSVVGDFNQWKPFEHQMSKLNEQGVWYIFIESAYEYATYKYHIVTQDNQHLYKADPFAFHSETRPQTASKLYHLDGYEWNDSEFMKSRSNCYDKPMLIYELHIGTWKKKEQDMFYSYRELADEIIPYVLDHGFTHIELLPIIEHPYDGSWGYQGTGYYAATSRYGTPKDFMYFIDRCHQAGLYVILDLVPGHFCKDEHGLYFFDGKPNYEYANEDIRENKIWGTANFDLGKNEVRSFLISCPIFWINYFHIDGFRIDAVSNIIYYLGDKNRGENKKAIEMLQLFNTSVFEYHPNALMIAEDSSDFPFVTRPKEDNGLGFNYKWKMGWMNDVLKYFKVEPNERRHVHQLITFGIMYAYSENFILPFSHDEVVHGKKSLIDKMPGNYEQKFANFKLLIGLLMTYPGKKLIFMGGEFAHMSEWKDKEQLDWHLYQYPSHASSNQFVKDMILLNKTHKALHELDFSEDGFMWIDPNNHSQSIFTYIRKGTNKDNLLVIILNCSNQHYQSFRVGVPIYGIYKNIINSDDVIYGGHSQITYCEHIPTIDKMHQFHFYINVNVPALSILIYELKHVIL